MDKGVSALNDNGVAELRIFSLGEGGVEENWSVSTFKFRLVSTNRIKISQNKLCNSTAVQFVVCRSKV